MSKYWTAAPGGNMGLGFCEPVATFSWASQHITLFYVFLFKDTSFKNMIDCPNERQADSTIAHAGKSLCKQVFSP